jgi:hypothetical protein
MGNKPGNEVKSSDEDGIKKTDSKTKLKREESSKSGSTKKLDSKKSLLKESKRKVCFTTSSSFLTLEGSLAEENRKIV